MLNEDLIDPKDLKIAKLKQAIESFKKYDEERKKYYSSALVKLGEYESLMDELNENEVIAKLNHLVDSYRGIVIKYQKLKTNEKVPDDIKSMERVDLENKIISLQDKNAELEKKIKSLRKTNDELIVRLIKSEKDDN